MCACGFFLPHVPFHLHLHPFCIWKMSIGSLTMVMMMYVHVCLCLRLRLCAIVGMICAFWVNGWKKLESPLLSHTYTKYNRVASHTSSARWPKRTHKPIQNSSCSDLCVCVAVNIRINMKRAAILVCTHWPFIRPPLRPPVNQFHLHPACYHQHLLILSLSVSRVYECLCVWPLRFCASIYVLIYSIFLTDCIVVVIIIGRHIYTNSVVILFYEALDYTSSPS